MTYITTDPVVAEHLEKLLTNPDRSVSATGRLYATGIIDTIEAWIKAEQKRGTLPVDAVMAVSDVAGALVAFTVAFSDLGRKDFAIVADGIGELVKDHTREKIVGVLEDQRKRGVRR